MNLRLWSLTLTTALAAALAAGALTGWWEVGRRQAAWTEACRRVWTENQGLLTGYESCLRRIASEPIDAALGPHGALGNRGEFWVLYGNKADQVLEPLARGLWYGEYRTGGPLTPLEIEVIRLGMATASAEAAVYAAGYPLRDPEDGSTICFGPMPIAEPTLRSLAKIHDSITGFGYEGDFTPLFLGDR